MQLNNEFCVYEVFDDDVYRVEEDPAKSLSGEFYDYYGAPQMPSYDCGSPFADYQEFHDYYGAPQMPSYDCGSSFADYQEFYDYYVAPQMPSYDCGSPFADYQEFYDYYDGAPQMPSYDCGSPFADYQDYSYDTYHYDCNAVYYLQPTYLIYYPVIHVQYSADYTYYPYYDYVPVYCQDCMLNYNYSLPTTACYVSDSTCIDLVPVYESPLQYSPVEPNLSASEEFDFDSYNIENRSCYETYESFEEKVGEKITTCHLFYEEYSEKLNGGPDEDKANRVKFDKRLEVDGRQSVQVDDRDSSCSVETSFPEEGVDENFIEKVPPIDMLQGKGDTNRKFSSEKFNGDKRKKYFDLKDYYFNDSDCLRFPKSEIRYEDESEKYRLYQLLASLKMDILKRNLEENYKKKKKKLYRKSCKGHRKQKKQLKELKWRRHRLKSIREVEEPEVDYVEMEGDETLKKDLPNVENDVVEPARESRKMDEDPQMVRVGDVYVRYAPDKYRVFCLENRRKKRFPSVRKFFGRIFNYVKKPI